MGNKSLKIKVMMFLLEKGYTSLGDIKHFGISPSSIYQAIYTNRMSNALKEQLNKLAIEC